MPSRGNRTNVMAAGAYWTEVSQMATFGDLYDSYHIGDIDIQKYTDSFADFTNTSIYLNLPYVGTKVIDVPSCMFGWLSVDYLIDRFTADCTAIVTVQDLFGNTELRYEWKGNVGKQVSFTQVISPYYRAVASATPAVVGMAIGAVGGLATGLIAGSVASKALNTPAAEQTPGQRLTSIAAGARAASG